MYIYSKIYYGCGHRWNPSNPSQLTTETSVFTVYSQWSPAWNTCGQSHSLSFLQRDFTSHDLSCNPWLAILDAILSPIPSGMSTSPYPHQKSTSRQSSWADDCGCPERAENDFWLIFIFFQHRKVCCTKWPQAVANQLNTVHIRSVATWCSYCLSHMRSVGVDFKLLEAPHYIFLLHVDRWNFK